MTSWTDPLQQCGPKTSEGNEMSEIEHAETMRLANLVYSLKGRFETDVDGNEHSADQEAMDAAEAIEALTKENEGLELSRSTALRKANELTAENGRLKAGIKAIGDIAIEGMVVGDVVASTDYRSIYNKCCDLVPDTALLEAERTKP